MAASGNNNECSVGIAPYVKQRRIDFSRLLSTIATTLIPCISIVDLLRHSEATLSFCKYTVIDWPELMITKLDSFDIQQNSFGPLACTDQNDYMLFTKNAEKNNACPFQERIEGLESPCDLCEFPLDINVPIECATIINLHCFLLFQSGSKLEEAACLEHMDLVLGAQCNYLGVDQNLLEAFTIGISEGRDGKGAIYVFAAGNEYTEGEDASQQSFIQNNRFTISVGAVAQDGLHAYYSTQGTTLFISAPGGSETLNSVQQAAANAGGVDVCTNTGSGKLISEFAIHLPRGENFILSSTPSLQLYSIGTSFATPVVSGVIALVLDANPDLTWRDVQAILASTAQVVDDGTDETAQINSAGYWHSNKYGFGIIDADAAVTAAEGWENLGPERMTMSQSGPLNVVIPDDITAPISTSLLVEDSNLITETVYVYISLEHSSRGELEISLTSPGGMTSRLVRSMSVS
jgi:Subtilase family/Proprotein convertase P-domain